MRRILRATDWPTSVVGSLMIVALFTLKVWDPALVAGLRLKVFDQLQLIEPRPAQAVVPIAVVEIDDRSLNELGQWPWPRDLFAELIDRLKERGALTVVFDVIFAEADRYSPPNYAKRLATLAPDVAARLAGLPDTDQRMAQAMRSQPVVLGISGLAGSGESAPMPTIPVTIASMGVEPDRYINRFERSTGITETLAENASGIGLVTITADVDGIVRRVPLVAKLSGSIVPSLALEALRTLTGERTMIVRGGEHGLDGISMRGVMIPTTPDGRVWVRYGEPDFASYVSAADVLNGTADPAKLDGRVIFVGGTAAGLGDIKTVPGGRFFAGVEIQRQLLETMLSGIHLQRPTALVNAERLVLLVFGLALAWTGPLLRASFIPPLLATIVALAAGTTWYLFTTYHLLFDGAYLAMAIGVLLFWLAMAKYIREEAQRRRIRSAFSRYLSPVMVDRLTRSTTALRLGGEKREMTILFSDIRGFTTISEAYAEDPEGLTHLLNRYFTAMTETIQGSGGTIDKFIGDAIMAFWNAPLAIDAHAQAACRAALRMRDKLAELNHELMTEAAMANRSVPELKAGIGLNAGVCFVGNLGSDQRFNYSVIGDPVNLASRIEGRTKGYGVDILIGEAVWHGIEGLAALEADRVQVVGKTAATVVYALIGDETVAATPAFAELAAEHEVMLQAYRARDWNACERLLARCRPLSDPFRLDKLYALYAERVAGFRANPPPVDWNGSEIATSKS